MFKLYLVALIELAITEPTLLNPRHTQYGPWMIHQVHVTNAQECKTIWKDFWQTKVYRWEEVEDLDFCQFDLVLNETRF